MEKTLHQANYLLGVESGDVNRLLGRVVSSGRGSGHGGGSRCRRCPVAIGRYAIDGISWDSLAVN